MKLFTCNKGAVSVFLVMILVPTLIVTSLFVDVSRMYLGRSVTESAGDLALNSKLSQYDKELSDMYGLFANAQNTDDVSNNLNKYFDQCLVSAGVETTDVSRWGNKLSDLIDDETGEEYTDLLNINVSKPATITNITKANLSNPGILKNQIVSFMKYRAPVNLFQSFIDTLKSTKSLSVVEEEADLTDKMNKYYESQNEVLKNLHESYELIKTYNTEGGMNSEYVNKVVEELNGLKGEYKTYHEKMFKDLYNTQGVNINTNDDTINDFSTKYKLYKDMKEDEAKDKFDKYVNEATTALNKYKTVYDKLIGLENEFATNTYVLRKPVGEGFTWELTPEVYPIQWYVAVSKKCGNVFTDYAKKANSMNDAVAKAYKASELSGIKSEKYNKLISNFESYAKNPNDKSKKLNEISRLYVTTVHYYTFNNLVKNVYNKEFKDNTSTTDVNGYISAIAQNLNDNYGKIESAKKTIKDAKNFIEKAKTELTKKDGTNVCYGNWETALNNDKLAAANSSVKIESEKVKNNDVDTIQFREKVTEKSLQEMYDRLQNIENLLQEMLDDINSFKYNGVPVKSIKTYEKFKNSSGINENDIKIMKTELDANASSSFKFSPENGVNISITDSNNPDITHSPVPSIYLYMIQYFLNTDENNTTANSYKHKYETQKTDNDTEASFDTGSSSDISTNEILKAGSGGDNGEKTKITKKISDIASKIKGLISGLGEYIDNPVKARDDLYVLDYAMNMFSYDTYNKEGLYNLAYDNGESGLNVLSTVEELRQSEEYKTAWANEKTTFTKNKSLTNYMVNSSNNYSFGNEIEYILYGMTNSENKSAVSAKLFLIRYVCNLSPEFSKNWNSSELIGFASIISAAIPWIPATLIKIVVILALTAAEAADDVKCLKEGMKVELIKPNENLNYVFSIEKMASGLDQKEKAASEIKGVQYSDYLSIFLFINLINTKDAEPTMKRMCDVIGRNVGMAKGIDEFDMKKANTYFRFTTTVQVDPLLLSMPVIKNESANKVNSVSWWSWEYSLTRGYN